MVKETIENLSFSDVLEEKYLSYALSTIMSRSLPDVRDGLKPVHRRILYAMQQLRLRPDEAYKKCARVVGDVIGKYHPHGDTAVYDTLVRLAQDFSLRYPLINGQGNFGSIDGDNPAAMRYTESKLTPIAMKLMEDLEKDTSPFKPTYDDSDSEPGLLPAKFPNLLCNGSEGIAVGMATSIPPHNLEEICNGLIYLVDKPDAESHELMSFIEGPDFPTGGIIYDSKANIKSIYETGRGSLRIRAKWEREEFGHGLYQIVITEIPYQVQKSKLIANIASLLHEKKIPLVANIRDESAEDVRVIIEPKSRAVDQEHVMESLFKQTDLEIRFNYNMNVITSSGLPQVMNLRQILEAFLEYRFHIITRRSTFDKNKIDARLLILNGMKIAYLNLDEVIKIIREEDEPKEILIRRFALSDIQAEAILNTRLRSLRKLEEQAIDAEIVELTKRRNFLCKILENKDVCWGEVKKEIKEIISEFGKNTLIGARRTIFVEQSSTIIAPINIEAFIEKEAITIIFSQQGWVRSIKSQVEDESALKFKNGDSFGTSIKAYTTDYILLASKRGRFYSVFANDINKNKGHGDPIRMMIDLADDDEIIGFFVYNQESRILLCSRFGKGFITAAKDVYAQTKQGKQVMNLSEGDYCIKILLLENDANMIGCCSTERKIVVFNLDELPTLKRGNGVGLMKLKPGIFLSDVTIFNGDAGFKWRGPKEIKYQQNIDAWKYKRGSMGKAAPFGFSRTGLFD
ncbi:MAG: DNA topoisomerase IV subunit A [Rickettsiaceae bacterium]|nr:DNA topoisomerase IV subunit A [Rickettsiaceae bacterium]